MKKSIYIVFLLTIINCQLSFAQKQGQAYIDSLLKELPKAKEYKNIWYYYLNFNKFIDITYFIS